MAGDYMHWNLPITEDVQGGGQQKPELTRYRRNDTRKKIKSGTQA
jgi:hypothetical protein